MSQNQAAEELAAIGAVEESDEIPAPDAWKKAGSMALALMALEMVTIIAHNTSNLASLTVVLTSILVIGPGLFAGLGMLQGSKTARGGFDTLLVPQMVGVLSAMLVGEENYQALTNAPYLFVLFLGCVGLLVVAYRAWMQTQQRKFDNSPESMTALQKSIELAEKAPAFAPEEFESKPHWQKTGQLLLVLTVLEALCLLLYNTDLFPRISASFADGFEHFPGGALLSLLLALGSGVICALGMMRESNGIRAFTEMRVALGAGQVIVYLLLSELVISDEIWRIFPFFLLLGVLVATYLTMGKTRQSLYQSNQ